MDLKGNRRGFWYFIHSCKSQKKYIFGVLNLIPNLIKSKFKHLSKCTPISTSVLTHKICYPEVLGKEIRELDN
jgi:hypothetical protein